MDSKADSISGSAMKGMYNATGWRWFGLGVMLLTVIGAGIYAARHDPLAVSAIFIAVPATLRVVPSIIKARSDIFNGLNCSAFERTSKDGAGDSFAP
jgi:hypothetical protein